MPPAPEVFSLTATTVRRTDTAAPAAEPAAETPPPVATSDADAGTAPVTATPSAGQAAALAALDGQHGALAQCYEQALRTAPEAVGRANVELTVTAVGAVTGAEVRVEGEGGLASIRPCVEAALRTVTFTGMPAAGATIRRSYSFVNPAIEVALEQPLRVVAPARGARPAVVAPTAESAAASVGVLTGAEISPVFATATPALLACYSTTLRRAARAAGAGEARFTVQADGTVASATWSSSVEPIALMGECIGPALRALHFRASATVTNVRGNIEFAR